MINPSAHSAQPVPLRTFAEDFKWQEKFVPKMAARIGEALLRPAPTYLDRNRNVDLVLRCDGNVSVACRVRRFAYLSQYGGEITLRATRPSGAATEIDKIETCPTSHGLYAFSDETETDLAAWTIYDLAALRDWYRWHTQRTGNEPGTRKRNPDGTEFIAIPIDPLPSGIVIARQVP